MPALQGHRLLEVLERGLAAHPAQRAATLLGASASLSESGVRALTIGERNVALLAAERASSGRGFEAVCGCPRCGELTAFDLDMVALVEGLGEPAEGPLEVRHGDESALVRLPTVADLDAACLETTEARARRRLLDRCVVEATRNGEAIAATDLSDTMLDAIADAMNEGDPGAEILFELTCPACEHAWQADFDVADHAWRQVEGRARRLAAEVGALARVYHWSEAEILAMTPARRRLYLGLVPS